MTGLKIKKHRKSLPVDLFLQWAYQNERIDTVVDRGGGLYPAERAADGIDVRRVAAGGGYMPLGTKVDFSGVVSSDAHPDAELVHDLISSRAFTAYKRGILLDYAKSGIEPDWMPGASPVIVPKYDRKGRIVVRYDDSRHPVYCLIEVKVSQELIQTMRGFYCDWYDAMRDLTYKLWAADSNLTSFNILPLEKNREPWKTPLTLRRNLDRVSEDYSCA